MTKKSKTTLKETTCARIPTPDGEFKLCLYITNQDDKEHLALIMGDVENKSDVLVRVHSECFTGDVLGSKRCDCGEQLHEAMAMISQNKAGIVLYLRQEGRGIGLAKKLAAYNLQDEGYDTVEANIMLGHQPDERDYSIAALILEDLGVKSVQLLTNNPEKVESLNGLGIPVSKRLSLTGNLYPENKYYLQTKVARMRHIMNLEEMPLKEKRKLKDIPELMYLQDKISNPAIYSIKNGRPFITISYAQSVDGSIASHEKEQMQLSGKHSLILTHQLRSMHDAILIGIETVLADDPQLTVRHVEGDNPIPIVLDTKLRMPLNSKLMQRTDIKPLIISTTASGARAKKLEVAGAKILLCKTTSDGKLDVSSLVQNLVQHNINSIMVEGGSQVISSFLAHGLADQVIITVTPSLVGGLQAIKNNGHINLSKIKLENIEYHQLDNDLIIWAKPHWENE